MINAIILAAGESRRMGRLKPIIEIEGKTVLAHIEGALRNTDIDEIFIVVGFSAETIQQKSGINAQFVLNDNYQNGQFSSLQCGIRELPEDSSGVVVCLGDQPQIRAEWVTALINAFETSHADIIRPSFAEKSGHPILYSSSLYSKILDLPSTATAKELMQAFAASTVFVEIDSEGILYDADTPKDLQRIRKFLE